MITISQTLIKAKPQKNMSIAMQKSIYGIGPTRANDLIVKLTGRLKTPIKMFNSQHFRWVTYQCVRNSFLLKEKLRNLKRNNIKRLKLLSCYRGLRHLRYLPARGQRTKSNAMTARFLGSGTFEYVPKRPTNLLKKISSYIRRGTWLKQVSEEKYKKLLSRNFSMFQKNYGRLALFLNKKGRLGVFSKFMKKKKGQN